MKRVRFALIAALIVLCTVNVLYAETDASKKDAKLVTTSADFKNVKTYNDPDDHYKYRKRYKAYKEKTVSGLLAKPAALRCPPLHPINPINSIIGPMRKSL